MTAVAHDALSTIWAAVGDDTAVSNTTLVAQMDASRPWNVDDDMIGSFPPDGSAAAASDGTHLFFSCTEAVSAAGL